MNITEQKWPLINLYNSENQCFDCRFLPNGSSSIEEMVDVLVDSFPSTPASNLSYSVIGASEEIKEKIDSEMRKYRISEAKGAVCIYGNIPDSIKQSIKPIKPDGMTDEDIKKTIVSLPSMDEVTNSYSHPS